MDIHGTWYNELGSKMVINPISNGQITGTYVTAVSSTGCAKGSFGIVGLTDTDTGGEAVAFVVRWQNDNSNCESVTAWSGQAQTVNGEDQINAFWLLTVESASDQDWYATHVGQDLFTRVQPSASHVAKKLKVARLAHP